MCLIVNTSTEAIAPINILTMYFALYLYFALLVTVWKKKKRKENSCHVCLQSGLLLLSAFRYFANPRRQGIPSRARKRLVLKAPSLAAPFSVVFRL